MSDVFARLGGAGSRASRQSASPTSAGSTSSSTTTSPSRAAYAAALTQLRSRGDKYYELETLRGTRARVARLGAA